MSHIAPAFDGGQLAAAAPAKTRRIVDDFEAWITEVWPFYVAAADSRAPFTIDEVASKNKLPDPPKPKSQWGALPVRLQNAGIIRHHSAGGSVRAHHSLVHVWIGVPEPLRQHVIEQRHRARKEARDARAAEKKAVA
jgi:hypothetical protein